MSFKGSAWDDLYRAYGMEDYEYVPVLPIRAFDGIDDVPEICELRRIGVGELEAVEALIQVFAERKDVDTLEKCLSHYLKYYPCHRGINERVFTETKIVHLLFDLKFEEGIRRLGGTDILNAGPRYLTLCESDELHNLAQRVFYGVFYHDNTNMLGQVVCGIRTERSSRWGTLRMDVIESLLKRGFEMTPPKQNSPLTLALLRPNCLPVMQLMARHNGDFSIISERNPLGIPDALLVAIYQNPNMVPFILKVLGRLRVPAHINKKYVPEGIARFYSDNVCCELSRFKGLVPMVAQFAETFPICEKCREAAHIQSSIPTLMSLSRMAYRSQFTPAQLAEEIDTPTGLQEYHQNYVLLRDNPFDDRAFLDAMEERDPRKYAKMVDYLVIDNVNPYEEDDDDDHFWGYDDDDSDREYSDRDNDSQYDYEDDHYDNWSDWENDQL